MPNDLKDRPDDALPDRPDAEDLGPIPLDDVEMPERPRPDPIAPEAPPPKPPDEPIDEGAITLD